jgi:hypothetical protein
MSQGMLGNSEALRRIMGGPVCDLLVKLNGPDAPDYEAALNKILRREDVVWGPQFERNGHGHIVLTLNCLNLTGEQEIARLLAAGNRVSDYAKSCFLNAKKDGYDAVHRLEGERKIVLMPHAVIKRDSDRTTENLRKKGLEFGYQKPFAGIVPRIREAVTDEAMEKMGFWYIVALHDPITVSDGNPDVLYADRRDDGRWVDASWGDPDRRWNAGGASAFLLPAS